MDIAILGTGIMGKGIAQAFAQCKAIKSVYIFGRSKEKSVQARQLIIQKWEQLRERKKINDEDLILYTKRLVVGEDHVVLRSCTFIVEAIAEDLQAKKSLLQSVESTCGDTTIIGTNTSSLSITELSLGLIKPDRFVGLHFFNPTPVLQLVEIVPGLVTSAATTAACMDFARLIGKEPVVVTESPGFIVNRILIPMINEAVVVLGEGIASAKDIDTAMQLGANHPIGPLALADLIGIDVCLAIMENIYQETGDSKYRPHFLLKKMARGKLLGRKSGQGFHEYSKA
jgi:3-hydroxybutyryl-CoA dehydrogenase